MFYGLLTNTKDNTKKRKWFLLFPLWSFVPAASHSETPLSKQVTRTSKRLYNIYETAFLDEVLFSFIKPFYNMSPLKGHQKSWSVKNDYFFSSFTNLSFLSFFFVFIYTPFPNSQQLYYSVLYKIRFHIC